MGIEFGSLVPQWYRKRGTQEWLLSFQNKGTERSFAQDDGLEEKRTGTTLLLRRKAGRGTPGLLYCE
jgi:hypothetical protein